MVCTVFIKKNNENKNKNVHRPAHSMLLDCERDLLSATFIGCRVEHQIGAWQAVGNLSEMAGEDY